jgi:hypothetical protein
MAPMNAKNITADTSANGRDGRTRVAINRPSPCHPDCGPCVCRSRETAWISVVVAASRLPGGRAQAPSRPAEKPCGENPGSLRVRSENTGEGRISVAPCPAKPWRRGPQRQVYSNPIETPLNHQIGKFRAWTPRAWPKSIRRNLSCALRVCQKNRNWSVARDFGCAPLGPASRWPPQAGSHFSDKRYAIFTQIEPV